MSDKKPPPPPEEENKAEDEQPPPPPAEPYSISLSSKAASTMGRPTPKANIKGKETRQPQRVSMDKMRQTTPLTADDIDEDTIIGPSAGFVKTVYATSARMDPGHQVVAESTAADALALQSAGNRDAQTASFKVKGISWRAGFSAEFNQTPLGHSLHPTQLQDPGQSLLSEAAKKAGIVVRTVNPHLQAVLGQLLPMAFKKSMVQARGQRTRQRQICIYYLPSPQGSQVGFVHEFISPKDFTRKFYLYIQTSVGPAPVSILEEILKTLEGGLPEGEKADDYAVDEGEIDVSLEDAFTFGEEVEQSIRQVSKSFRDSILYLAFVRGWNRFVAFLPTLFRIIDRGAVRVWRGFLMLMAYLTSSWPMQAIGQIIIFFSDLIVNFVLMMNRWLLAFARSALARGLVQLAVFVGQAIVLLIRGVRDLLLLPFTLLAALQEYLKELLGFAPPPQPGRPAGPPKTQKPAAPGGATASPVPQLKGKTPAAPAAAMPAAKVTRPIGPSAPPPQGRARPLDEFEDEPF